MKKLHRKLFRGHLLALGKFPVFIHIPKTSGTYLTKCFKRSKQRVNETLHTPARFLKLQFKDQYTNKPSFAIIRNPYERFASACLFNGVTCSKEMERLSEMIVAGNPNYASEFSINHYEHFCTQHHFITDFDNETIIVNHLLSFENLDNSVSFLKTIGIDITSVFKYKEPTVKKNMLTKKTIKNIDKIYKDDFELLTN